MADHTERQGSLREYHPVFHALAVGAAEASWILACPPLVPYRKLHQYLPPMRCPSLGVLHCSPYWSVSCYYLMFVAAPH